MNPVKPSAQTWTLAEIARAWNESMGRVYGTPDWTQSASASVFKQALKRASERKRKRKSK